MRETLENVRYPRLMVVAFIAINLMIGMGVLYVKKAHHWEQGCDGSQTVLVVVSGEDMRSGEFLDPEKVKARVVPRSEARDMILLEDLPRYQGSVLMKGVEAHEPIRPSGVKFMDRSPLRPDALMGHVLYRLYSGDGLF